MRGSRSKSVGVVAALAIAVTTLMAPIAIAATEAPPSPTGPTTEVPTTTSSVSATSSSSATPTQPPSTTSSSSATPTAPTTTIVQNETPTVVLLASRTTYRENALLTPFLFTFVYLDDQQLARGTLELFIDNVSYGEFRTNGIRLIRVPRGPRDRRPSSSTSTSTPTPIPSTRR